MSVSTRSGSPAAWDGITRVLVSAFGAGYSPVAPGTAGTAAAVVLVFLLSRFAPPLAYLWVFLAITLGGTYLAGRAEKIYAKKDPGQVVLDEIAGFMVTMAFLPVTGPILIAAFFLFRFTDIVKPFPARWIDKNLPGGWGIMLDDLVSGIYAHLLLRALIRWVPGFELT